LARIKAAAETSASGAMKMTGKPTVEVLDEHQKIAQTVLCPKSDSYSFLVLFRLNPTPTSTLG